MAISDPATAHFTAHKKPRKHKNCIQTKAHAHPHTPLNIRSQKKPSDTATHKPQHAKGGAKYQYKLHTVIKLLEQDGQ
jgi:hypothetical protein